MKIILITSTLILLLTSCKEEPKEVYETSIQSYVISHKEKAIRFAISSGNGVPAKIYFQTTTNKLEHGENNNN